MERLDPAPLEDFGLWSILQNWGRTTNIPLLKDLAGQWIRMATQKTAGQKQYAKKGDIDFENIERIRMGILWEAAALVFSGRLDKIEREADADGADRQEAIPPAPGSSTWSALLHGAQRANIPQLKALVHHWVRRATQRTDRQEDRIYGTLENVKMAIVCEAVALVLSGELDKIDGEDNPSQMGALECHIVQ